MVLLGGGVSVGTSTSARSVADGAPDVAHGQTRGERVVGLQDVLRVSGDPRPALDGGHHGVLAADGGALVEQTAEGRPQDALVHERDAELELAAGVQSGHPGTGTGSAG